MKNSKIQAILIPALLGMLTISIIILIFNLVDEEIENAKVDEALLMKNIKEPTLKFEDENKTSSYEIVYDKYDEYLISKEHILPIQEIDENQTSVLDSIPTPVQKMVYSELNQSSSPFDEPKKVFSKLPKMVIIVDDVSFEYQVKEIEKLNLNLTMSFLPANKTHPSTPNLANSVENHMIHLPLEALAYPREEIDTLYIKDSVDKIEEHIRVLRDNFPKAKYVNNHTGSKFTSDLEAMKRLIGVLNNYGFYFVDSKTTKDTVVKEVMEIYNMKYITRDIFLDNKENKEYIKKQIKKAIKLAKRSGFTIAICHPKKATFDALQESKKLLDSSVEILNIYEVEGLLK